MRILVGIEACESYVHRLSACRRWMPALQAAGVDCLLVFGGGDRREGDRLWLPVSPLGTPHLVQRTRHLARYALAAGYDYLFKCDDDAAIHPARFAGYDPPAAITSASNPSSAGVTPRAARVTG